MNQLNDGKKNDIYLASPLFCPEDHEGLDIVEKFLEDSGLTFFSPRLHSNAGPSLSEAKTPEERDAAAQAIFDLNKNAIADSRIIIANTIGTRWNNAIYGDAGTMVEVGMAFASHTPVMTYNFKGYGLNIMLSQEVVYHADSMSYEDASELNILNSIITEYKKLVKINTPKESIPSKLREIFFKIKDRELI